MISKRARVSTIIIQIFNWPMKPKYRRLRRIIENCTRLRFTATTSTTPPPQRSVILTRLRWR